MSMREALTLLHTLYPAQGLVCVGAGNGDFLEQVVLPPAPALLAIEADEALYTQLAAKIEQHPQGQALHQLVGGQDEAVPFYRHSSPKENGLLSATLLMPLWKNLRLREAITTPAQTLHNILASAGEDSPRYNWLTLACLPALPLLQGLGPTLQQFDVLQARVALTDNAALAKAGASRPAVDAWLQTQGFKPLLVQEETNAQLASVFYARDWKTQAAQTSQALTLAHQSKIEALQQEKAALTQARDVQRKLATERQAQLEALGKEKAELVAVRDALSQEKSALMQAHEQQINLVAEHQTKIETLDKEKTTLIHQSDVNNQIINDLEKKIKILIEEKNNALLIDKELSQEMASLKSILNEEAFKADKNFKIHLDEIKKLKKFIADNVKKEVANSAKQLGSFINLQEYIETGKLKEIDIEVNGWPASTDFLLHLVKQLEKNEYDAVIELGSGTSTLVIAQTLAHQSKNNKRNKTTSFISFDHLDKYYQITLARLQAMRLTSKVHLIHAPLADYMAPDGNTYSYYSCQKHLSALAEKLVHSPRLLVVVDGPPGSTGKHARYPIGPMLLQHFKNAHVDILLDDAVRPDEKSVVTLWNNDFSHASLTIEEEMTPLEKGCTTLKIRQHSFE
jgi:hypothetical protein